MKKNTAAVTKIAIIVGVVIAIAGFPVVGSIIGLLIFLTPFIREFDTSRPKTKHREGDDMSVEVAVSIGNQSRRISLDSDKSYTIGRPPTPKAKAFKFIPKDEILVVQGKKLEGLLYTGDPGRAKYDEPSVIDPKLRISDKGLPEALGYWSNYSLLEPRQRYEYLSWLANGRPYNNEMGYVFIYFYGLERYVLLDAKRDKPDIRDKNLNDILSELKRLRGMYADSRSFDNYSNQLLDLIYINHWPERLAERKGEVPRHNGIGTHHAIITHANTHRDTPLDADWALQWVIAFGSVNRTKAVRDNYPILRALFRANYEAETNGGLKIPSCKTKAKVNFMSAARGLENAAKLDYPENWFDPTKLRRPLSKLEDIFKGVMPSVRELAKAMESKDPLTILKAWPANLPLSTAPKLKQVSDTIVTFLTRHTTPPFNVLAKLFRMEVGNNVTSKQLKDMASALQSCGFILVPDPLLKSVSLKATDLVMAYRGERLAELSPEGLRIATSIQLGSILALADGEIHDREKDILSKLIGSHSNSSEREYLEHYLQWRLVQRPNTTGLKKHIEQLSQDQRHELAEMLIEVARADGVLPKEEIKELEKLFGRLGLATSSVTSMLHTSAAPSLQNISHGFQAKPSTVHEEQRGVRIDLAALEEHKKSTAEVQTVLSAIFDEDTEESPNPEVVEKTNRESSESWHEGRLDEAHHLLAEWLVSSDEWAMEKVTAKCKELGLMAEGALARINDTAFDTLGDSLVDIGDPVEVYRDVLPS
ncbi:MAG: hypothetical protein EP324_00765 [Gammaproteobacteria bacterium]|nr:MAG: hypothetical protein EP324_00765 [Gammaproteobacteria bacterium]